MNEETKDKNSSISDTSISNNYDDNKVEKVSGIIFHDKKKDDNIGIERHDDIADDTPINVSESSNDEGIVNKALLKKAEIIAAIIFAFLLLLIIGKMIAKDDEKESMIKPNDIVYSYFLTMNEGNFDDATEYLASVKKNHQTTFESNELFYKEYLKRFFVKIGEEKIDGDYAKINISVTKPDYMKALIEVRNKLKQIPTLETPGNEFTDVEIVALTEGIITRVFDLKELGTISKEYEITLKKVDENWKIVNDSVMDDVLFGS